jgi:hypothetical protein
MGKNRAVVGPAFKKAVKKAADHIKIRHRSHGLPKERTVSPLEIYCNSPEASSPPTTTNSPIKKRILLKPTLLKTFLRSIPENRKSDNPPKRATAEGFKKVFSERIKSKMTWHKTKIALLRALRSLWLSLGLRICLPKLSLLPGTGRSPIFNLRYISNIPKRIKHMGSIKMINSLNPIPVSDAINIFGKSPIMVEAPPRLDEMISPMINGLGSNLRITEWSGIKPEDNGQVQGHRYYDQNCCQIIHKQ